MAKDTYVLSLCDPCDDHKLPGMRAATSHTLSIDGGPMVELDFCVRDEASFQEVIRLYKEYGRPVPVAPVPQSTQPKKKAKAVKKPKELEQAPAEKPPAEKPAAKEKQYVRCPLPHSSTGGAPKVVAYTDRGTHADMVHDHAKMWDIAWEDPDGVLDYPCDVHTECMKTGLSFATSRGRAQHRYSCPLPHADQEQEGDSQKPDEPPAV